MLITHLPGKRPSERANTGGTIHWENVSSISPSSGQRQQLQPSDRGFPDSVDILTKPGRPKMILSTADVKGLEVCEQFSLADVSGMEGRKSAFPDPAGTTHGQKPARQSASRTFHS